MNLKFGMIVGFLLCAQLLVGQNSAISSIDKYLTTYKSNIPIPGFSVVIVENDRIVFSKGYGVETAGTNRKMTPHTPIAIASVGRSITAVAMMQLVEKGLVQLDQPVTNYLPWFKTANKNFSDQITVRMCLNNTSGIPSLQDFSPDLDPSRTLEKFVRSMSGTYIQRKPGTSHDFSDEGYSIAGLIISKLSGQSYPEYIQQNIFNPLKMNDSTTDPSALEGFSAGHEFSLEGCIPAHAEFVASHYLPAGSEMRSSSADIGNYLIALLNGGKYRNKQILSPESIEELFKDDITFRGLGTMVGGNGLDIGYALGWMSMKIEERDILIHTGNTGTMASIVGLNREKNQGIAILFNADVNRLDRYVYPTLENTANNIIHLLNNEDTTDFAVVRIDDPYDEDYKLPKQKWDTYIGSYSSYGKPHPLFAEMDIEIFIGASNELELVVSKNENMKGHYRLQFINESRAVLRSIAHPREIQFKLFPNGLIGGLYMFGSEFLKIRNKEGQIFKLIEDPNKFVSFEFPSAASILWQGANMTARIDQYQEVKYQLSIEALTQGSIEKLINTHIKGSIKTEGLTKTENINGGIWSEKIITEEIGHKIMQYVFIAYQDPRSQKQATLTIKLPWGKFSSETQTLIRQIQKTIRLN